MCTSDLKTIKWNAFYQISDNKDDSFQMHFHRSFKVAAKEHEHNHLTFGNQTCLFIALGVNLSSYCISNSTFTQRQTNNTWAGMLLKIDFQLKG